MPCWQPLMAPSSPLQQVLRPQHEGQGPHSPRWQLQQRGRMAHQMTVRTLGKNSYQGIVGGPLFLESLPSCRPSALSCLPISLTFTIGTLVSLHFVWEAFPVWLKGGDPVLCNAMRTSFTLSVSSQTTPCLKSLACDLSGCCPLAHGVLLSCPVLVLLQAKGVMTWKPWPRLARS